MHGLLQPPHHAPQPKLSKHSGLPQSMPQHSAGSGQVWARKDLTVRCIWAEPQMATQSAHWAALCTGPSLASALPSRDKIPGVGRGEDIRLMGMEPAHAWRTGLPLQPQEDQTLPLIGRGWPLTREEVLPHTPGQLCLQIQALPKW